MVGRTWRSELSERKDRRTGRTVTQLTSLGNNVHLYFTENSFDAHGNTIIFRSDRASGMQRAPHESPLYNLFRMDLDTGEILQLTDEPARDRQRDQNARQPYRRVCDRQHGQAAGYRHGRGGGGVSRNTASIAWARRRSAATGAISPSAATSGSTSPTGRTTPVSKSAFIR